MRSIFGKQLTVQLAVLAVSFTLLGAVLSQVIRQYFTDRQVDFVKDSASRAAATLSGDVIYGVLDIGRLLNQAVQMQQYLRANMVIIGAEYQVLIDTGGLLEADVPFHVPEFEALMAGTVDVAVLYGSANGQYRELRLTVGCPIRAGDGSVLGAVLVSTSMAELEETIFGMYRVTLICLGLSMALAFGLVYAVTRAIARPLRQMNEAAGVIAGGDFDKRIHVKSRDEVGQLAERFNHMADSLQEQERIRRTFIANISHDLRSPLTTIRGFLAALCDGTVPPEKQPHYLGVLLDESERLIKLSNDILDLQRIQDTELKPKRAAFDINGLIRRTLSVLEQRALDKHLSIRCSFAHETDRVLADAEMIQRALYNLLDNAMKFTDEGGSVTIETAVSDGKLTVTVQDDGRGISEEELRRIFERFYKSDASRGEDRHGSGLGLSIVEEFIRAHGERVTVVSEQGKGSAFSFGLPLADAAAGSFT